MRKRRIMAMTLAAVMAASLTACGGPDKGNTAGAPGQNQESAAKDSGAGSTEGVPSDSTGTGGGQVTLTYWSWLPTVEQSETMIADFEKANPDIKIDYIRTEQDDYFEKLQVAMASGTGPVWTYHRPHGQAVCAVYRGHERPGRPVPARMGQNHQRDSREPVCDRGRPYGRDAAAGGRYDGPSVQQDTDG